MQVIEHGGATRLMEPYDEDTMLKYLEEPDVREVRIFRMKAGMKININGTIFKVVTVRPNGKATLKPVGLVPVTPKAVSEAVFKPGQE